MMGRLGGRNKKSPEMVLFIGDLAEKVGFEPTVMLPPRLISSQGNFVADGINAIA